MLFFLFYFLSICLTLFLTVVNPNDLHCNLMKSVFQIKFYLILYIKNVAGLLHMTEQ